MKKKWFKLTIFIISIVSIGLIWYLFFNNNKITNEIPKSSKLVKSFYGTLKERRI